MIQVFNQYLELCKVLSLKLLTLSLFCMILIAFSGVSTMAFQKVVAQQQSPTSHPTSNASKFYNTNTTSANKGHVSMALLNQIKPMIL
jgi:hypothetical protein